MTELSEKIDKDALGFELIRNVVELTRAAHGQGKLGRDVLFALIFAIGDLTRLLKAGGKDVQHAEMVARIIVNVAQPNGAHALKAAKALKIGPKPADDTASN